MPDKVLKVLHRYLLWFLSYRENTEGGNIHPPAPPGLSHPSYMDPSGRWKRSGLVRRRAGEWITDRSLSHVWHPIAFARELLCLNRVGSMLDITSQWQDPDFLFFYYKSILPKIRSHAETPRAKVLFWSIRLCKEYRRKTGPREAETDSSTW